MTLESVWSSPGQRVEQFMEFEVWTFLRQLADNRLRLLAACAIGYSVFTDRFDNLINRFKSIGFRRLCGSASLRQAARTRITSTST